jgi:hypothetical protein
MLNLILMYVEALLVRNLQFVCTVPDICSKFVMHLFAGKCRRRDADICCQCW